MNSLYNQDTLTQKQIAEAHHMPKQTVNNIILRYQKPGYVEMIRNKEDGRARTIHLTENGRKYVNETLQPVIRLNEVIMERMGKNFLTLVETIEQYSRLLSETIQKGTSH